MQPDWFYTNITEEKPLWLHFNHNNNDTEETKVDSNSSLICFFKLYVVFN